MGFKKYPTSVLEANPRQFSSPQRHMLAQFLGVMGLYKKHNGAENRCNFLMQAIKDDPERAQEGYDVLILGKNVKGNDQPISEVLEKRMYQILRDVVIEHKETLGDQAVQAVSMAADSMKKRLEEFAKEQITKAAEKVRPIVIKEGSKTRKVKGVLPPEFKRMVELASERIPIMLVGPAGCGKTFLCEKLSEALDLEYSDQSCSEGMSESVFNGLLLPIGKNGEFKHVASPFLNRYETGGVMLLDEIDAGDPNLFTYINKAIANDSYTVAQRWHNPRVEKHEDFVLVAAANTFGHGADAMYVGRNQLDAATLDRFRVGLITLDYCKEVEESIASTKLCEWAWKIRDSIRRHRLRRIMSTRVIKDLAAMTRRYEWDTKEWNMAYFSGWSESERNLVMEAAG